MKDQIKAFFGTELADKGITDSENLLMAGIIDSLRMEELISYLKEQFQIEIDMDDMMPDNFETVDAITGFVEQKKAA